MDMSSEELQELQSIKKLLVALLVKLGASSEEVGEVLGVDSSTVRKMVPIQKIKKLELGERPHGETV
jgi:predicted transcriptional regulator